MACRQHDDDDDDDDATVAATELIISIIITDRSAQTHSDLSASTDDQSGSNAAKRRPVSQHLDGTSVRVVDYCTIIHTLLHPQFKFDKKESKKVRIRITDARKQVAI